MEELRALIKKIKAVVWPQTAEYSEVNAVGGLGGRNSSKPDPWDGDTEQEFTKRGLNALRRTWPTRETKVWRKILKSLQVMGDDDDSLHDVNDVKQATCWQTSKMQGLA